MTLILKFDLDIVQMSYYTTNAFSMSRHSKVIAQAHAQTHTHTDGQTHTHTQTVLKHYLPAYAGGNNS